MSTKGTPRDASVWKALALSGAVCLFIGFGALLVDYRVYGGVDFIDQHIGIFQLAILIGMLALFVGLIGWAKCLDRYARIRMGIFLLLAPICVCILGSLIGGTNVHGPFFLIFLPMFPISVMGLVLLIVVAISSGY